MLKIEAAFQIMSQVHLRQYFVLGYFLQVSYFVSLRFQLGKKFWPDLKSTRIVVS